MKNYNLEILSNREETRIFRYRKNVGGLRFLMISSILLLTAATLAYPLTHFDPPQIIALTILCALGGLILAYVVIRWTLYAGKAYVALDKDTLYVGFGNANAQSVELNALTRETVSFGDAGKETKGELILTSGNERIALRLVNPFVCLEDFTDVLVLILSQIKINEQKEVQEDKCQTEDPESIIL